jgi:hypothetical protein
MAGTLSPEDERLVSAGFGFGHGPEPVWAIAHAAIRSGLNGMADILPITAPGVIT